MKAPLSWLKEYVPITEDVDALAHRLTMGGTEVAGIQRIGEAWNAVVVGRVQSVRPHPNADRLRLVTVDAGGEDDAKEVVCGAPDVAEGQKIAYASVGASLIDPKTGERGKLKRAKIRGVVSEGMVCSERELGLGENHEGIVVLDPDAPVGAPLQAYLGETVLDFDLTPNRPDCLGILGIAREIAALADVPLTEPRMEFPQAGPDVASVARVRIEDPDLCPRYTGAVIQGVEIGPSPQWLVQRLAAIGQGSINNVVDITNYVMFELGQPLHAFDLDQVTQSTVVVRRAKPGERLVTLDGEDRKLNPEMLLIADPEKGIGLAGVMGGANSEIHEGTTNVFLESATFNGANNRRTAAELGMRTEATVRFEKGLRPSLAEVALRRATCLILEVAGGTAAKGILDAWPSRDTYDASLFVHRSRLKQILGVDFEKETVVKTLLRLGFGVEVVGKDYDVVAPYWRPDVTRPEDVAEELARTVGYDHIPTETIAGKLPRWEPDTKRAVRERVRDLLAAAGLQETVSYPLTTESALSQAGDSRDLPQPLRVANPVAADYSVLRTHLRRSVLGTLVRNERTWRGPIALFEIGRAYLHWGEGLPEERETAVGVLAGPREEPRWNTQGGRSDFYDAKGVVEVMLDELKLRAGFEPAEDGTFMAGRCARVSVNGERVGVVGEVAEAVLSAVESTLRPVAMFEIDLDRLGAAAGEHAPGARIYEPFPRFPESLRDLAVLVEREVPAGEVVTIIERNKLVSRVTVFDVFEGKGIPSGRKSLALRVSYQSSSRTLTSEDVSKAEASILRALEREVGASLRS